MSAQLPQVEIVTSPTPGNGARLLPWYRSRRMRMFLWVFLVALLVGQLINFARPAVYRSSATVLTVAPPGVDTTTSSTNLDLQHVAIQRQLLLGQDLMVATLQRLQQSGRSGEFALNDVTDFQNMLAVSPIPDSHLVELSADGDEPEQLEWLVNNWIEAYLQFREQVVQRDVGETLEKLDSQYEELGAALERKRAELAAFRENHEILTEERGQNLSHSRLTGLNKSLNDAREAEVEAQSQLQAVQEAIEAGEPVVPDSEKSSLVQMQVEAETLREKLAEYDKRFTPEYRLVNPEFENLPGELDNLDRMIRLKIRQGQKILLADARSEVMLAQLKVRELQRQLRAHQADAAEFTARFTEQQGMVKDLEGLEEVYREIEQRMQRIKSKSLEKYPQVRVVDWAFEPTTPLYPHYWRDALFVFIGSLVLGIIGVWVNEYLRREPEASTPSGGMSGVRIYADNPALSANQAPDAVPPALKGQPSGGSGNAALASPSVRELTESEIDALWKVSHDGDRLLLGLLLSGLTSAEITACDPLKDFDIEAGTLGVQGAAGRRLSLSSAVQSALGAADKLPVDDKALDAALKLLAYDAGLAFPDQLTAAVFHHTYALYLVRQGARLREIERIIGAVPPQQLAAYGPYSPKGPGKPLEQLNIHYPLRSV